MDTDKNPWSPRSFYGSRWLLFVLRHLGTSLRSEFMENTNRGAANFNELTRQIVAFRDARDWKQFHKPKDVAISLVLEATELMEHFQWKDANESTKHVVNAKEEIGEELADVLYWVLLMSHDLNIDIAAALEKKIKKNEAKYPVEKARGSSAKYTELQH